MEARGEAADRAAGWDVTLDRFLPGRSNHFSSQFLLATTLEFEPYLGRLDGALDGIPFRQRVEADVGLLPAVDGDLTRCRSEVTVV